MTGSYFNKKIILILALMAFVIGGSFPTASHAALTDAERNAAIITANNGGGSPESQLEKGVIGKSSSEKSGEIYCFKPTTIAFEFSFSGCIATATFVMLQVASWVLWVSAILFNATLSYTLNMAGFLRDIPIVAVGWATFRDLTNLMFVFIILYIAINTIIGNEGYGIKKLLGKVIVGAMLINFSLFFTQVMIDASNIFALQFYHRITVDAAGQNISSGTAENNSDYDAGISAAFVNAMGLQQIYNLGKGTQAAKTGESSVDLNDINNSTKLGLNANNLILVGIGGTILVLVTAFVFFAATFMFLARTLVLVFLMILSPIAFMGNILPALGKYTGVWWSKLINNLLFAPVYMMMFYLVMSMIIGKGKKFTGVNGASGNFADMFAGGTGWTGTVMTFVVLIGLMLGCLMIASSLGVIGGKWAESTGKAIAFGGALSAGKWTGGVLSRNTIGRGAAAISQSEIARKYAPDKVLRGINSLADKKFGRISFVDRKKEKTDLDVKALELRSEVGPRRDGETDTEFKARKEEARTMAAGKLGLERTASNFTDAGDKRKGGQIFGKSRLALSQAAWIKKSGKSAKDNLDDQITALEAQDADFDETTVNAAQTALVNLKNSTHPESVAHAYNQITNLPAGATAEEIARSQAIYTARSGEMQRLQSIISKNTDVKQRLASARARKAELDSK